MSRELDVECARAMGTELFRTIWMGDNMGLVANDAPHYSTDPTAARLLEDEIERRGLWREYVGSLKSEAYGDDPVYDEWGILMWSIIRATPEERARAFLATLHDAPAP